MTEEEAKTTPCIGPENCGKRATEYQPFIAYGMSTVQMYERDEGLFQQWKATNPRLCIGSACLAWRFRSTIHMSYAKPDGDAVGWVEHIGQGVWHKEMADGGYCGLAGKP